MQYQAVVRDNQGKIMENRRVVLRFSILKGSISGQSVYTEAHQTMSNEFGLVNLIIGKGVPESGDISLIDWNSGVYFLQVEIDVNGGTDFVMVSISRFLTVPFAFHARTVELDSVNDADADPANEIQSITKTDWLVTLSHGGGSFIDEVNDGDYDSNNELQFLYMNGDTIFLHSGGYVVLPPSTLDWRIDGNSGMVDSVHFLGTSDQVPIRLRTNNQWAGELNPVTGNISFGDSANYQSGGMQNVVIGNRALFSNTDRSNLVAIGDSTLFHNGIGASAVNHGFANLAIGSKALYSNTTGRYNQAIGAMSLFSNTTGIDNLGIGFKTLYSNISGQSNLAFGYTSMYSNTTGNLNIAIGNYSLYNNTVGYGNLALGYFSLYDNTEGYGNMAAGYLSLRYNTSGSLNTSAGYYSLFNNTTGNSNTGFGAYTIRTNSTGSANSGFGQFAIYLNTDGSYNSALGYAALYRNTTGNYNTAIGSYAFLNGADFYNSTAIGYYSAISASNQVRIGNSSVTSIGGYTNWTNISDGRVKTHVQQDVPGLEFIRLLKPVTFTLNMDAVAKLANIPDSARLMEMEKLASGFRRTGFIAQEVESAAKSIGFSFSGVDAPGNPDDFYGLRYAEFVVPLVRGMQEQQFIIESQQAQINQMLEMIEELRLEIQTLMNQ